MAAIDDPTSPSGNSNGNAERKKARHSSPGGGTTPSARALRADPSISIVLMDVMMPEMDGYETTQQIRKDPRFADLPIIAVTAKALKDDKEKCIAAGASDYLPKPIDPARLVDLIRMWLTK